MEILELFTNRVAIFDLDVDIDSLQDDVRQVFEEDPEGVKHSNIGGWQSTSIAENPAFNELFQARF